MEEKSERSESPSVEVPAEKPHPKVLPIHVLGSSILRMEAVVVPEITDEIRDLATLMTDTMFHSNGVGLAAPQIGVPIRMFVMLHQVEGKVLRLINPEINTTEGEQEFDEGCLSQPGLTVRIKRPKMIAVSAIDIDSGSPVIVEGTDLEAAILSHEIDHLNGVLLVDRLSRLKRDIYKRKLKKNMKRHDIAAQQQASVLRDERDHPRYTEPS